LEAKGFYAAVAVATLIGVVINLAGIDPMQALYGSAVLNGVVAVPTLAMMLRVGTNPDAMGEFTIPPGLRLGGWIAVAVMAACVTAMAATSLLA